MTSETDPGSSPALGQTADPWYAKLLENAVHNWRRRSGGGLVLFIGVLGLLSGLINRSWEVFLVSPAIILIGVALLVLIPADDEALDPDHDEYTDWRIG